MNAPDYRMDVPYVRGFLEDAGPARLRLVAALAGIAPPPAEDFDHCDLGSGHGDTTATLAACHPKARFVGVDLNPGHIATARAIASAGELDNARFVEHDFADLGGQGLPSFDYVAAHGILSWIAPETRARMLAFASSKLKQGGLLYVGYNALPGWAVIEPLRRLLVDRAGDDAVTGGPVERARAALLLAEELAGAGARYFARNQPARDMLATLGTAGLAYVVHEFLQPHWLPMYFADVARELEALDLHFVGQLPVYLNDRELGVPPGVAPLLAGVRDRTAYEGLAAYATNVLFRRDVYVKGRSSPAEATTNAYLDATAFGPLVHRTVPRSVNLAYHRLDFVGEVFDALLPLLGAGATSGKELAARPELARHGVARVRSALQRLLLGGEIAPFLRPSRSTLPRTGRHRVPSAYNRAVLARPLSTEAPFALASPVAGTGIVLTPIQVVALRLFTEVPAEERASKVRALCEPGAFAAWGGDTSSAPPSEAALLHEVEGFRRERLGKLVELGVVESG